jgi:hypothetical protein
MQKDIGNTHKYVCDMHEDVCYMHGAQCLGTAGDETVASGPELPTPRFT